MSEAKSGGAVSTYTIIGTVDANGKAQPVSALLPLPGSSALLVPKGYQQLTVNASGGAAVGFTVPLGATKAIFTPVAAVRWRDDGTDPTSAVGYPVTTGQPYLYDGALAAFKVISQGAATALDISYYA